MTAAAIEASEASLAVPKLEFISLSKLIESPWNPRKRFNPEKQATLASSIREHGQLVPGVVRSIAGGKFEIAAGHRRSRAAQAAGIGGFLTIVRDLTDAEFCEILAIENDERDDVHPLEQANGFKLLMERSGYDVAKIATRIQRSHDFVHDRLRLLQLIPELKEHFLADRFLLAHAVILSRLTPAHQKAAMRTDPVNRYQGNRHAGGLYREDLTLDHRLFPYVANSPGELQEWVNDNCRFVPEAEQLEEDFPETAVILESAQETGTKVVYITDNFMVSNGARDPNVKTIGEKHWKRADGEQGSKPCDKAVVGVYADGDTRGQAIGVCVSKTSCLVHWGTEVRARKAREDKKGASGAKKKPAKAKALQPYTPAQIRAKRTLSIRAAAIKPMTEILRRAHEKPSPEIVAAAKSWATKEVKAKGSLTTEQLLVALFAGEFDDHRLQWKLRERPEELKAFGVDEVLKRAALEVKTCKYCGCSVDNACDLGYAPNTYARVHCAWATKEKDVCTNPVCLAQHQKAGGTVAATALAESVDAPDNDDDEGFFDD